MIPSPPSGGRHLVCRRPATGSGSEAGKLPPYGRRRDPTESDDDFLRGLPAGQEPASRRLLKKVQMQGGARRAE